MSYVFRKGKKGESVQIRVSKRGTKEYFTRTVHIPKGLTMREKKRFADQEERKFENECKGGSKNVNILFRRFVEEDYFENNPKKDDHKSMIARTLPAPGHFKMNEITRSVIQNFINRLLTNADTKSGKPVSVKTVRNNISFISDVFRYAISTGMNIENPCRDLTYPRMEKNEKAIYSEKEIQALLDAIEKYPPETKYKLFIYIAITTGMRKGEILGLEWKNIDLETGIINIVQSAKYNKTEGMHIGQPKTQRSVRKVKVPQKVVELMRVFKAEQEEYIINMGSKWVGTDFLFTQYDGGLMSIQTPYEWLKAFCEEHGLVFRGIHCARHTFASHMIASKMDIVQVSRTLGHTLPSTTLNIYSHLLQDASDDACSVAEGILSKKKTHE